MAAAFGVVFGMMDGGSPVHAQSREQAHRAAGQGEEAGHSDYVDRGYRRMA